MDDTVISFRLKDADMQVAVNHCEQNDIDISCYIMLALLRYLGREAQKGEIECPPFLEDDRVLLKGK